MVSALLNFIFFLPFFMFTLLLWKHFISFFVVSFIFTNLILSVLSSILPHVSLYLSIYAFISFILSFYLFFYFSFPSFLLTDHRNNRFQNKFIADQEYMNMPLPNYRAPYATGFSVSVISFQVVC